VHVHDKTHLVDIVGTGGDGANTFNISTCSTFVIAAAGGKVSKHGGRSVSSKSGSADVMEALGVNINLQPAQIADCIRDMGIGFMFAPNHHPAMKNVAPVRKELGVRTIFNILGPLTNPAGAPNILMGVFHEDLVGIQVRALQRLGPSMHWWCMAVMGWMKSAWARARWWASSRTAWCVNTKSTPKTLACAWWAHVR
jgi:anthranilate phosphoribosyltransferase